MFEPKTPETIAKEIICAYLDKYKGLRIDIRELAYEALKEFGQVYFGNFSTGDKDAETFLKDNPTAPEEAEDYVRKFYGFSIKDYAHDPFWTATLIEESAVYALYEKSCIFKEMEAKEQYWLVLDEGTLAAIKDDLDLWQITTRPQHYGEEEEPFSVKYATITAEEIEDTYAVYEPLFNRFDIWATLKNGEDVYLTNVENVEDTLRYIYMALDKGKTLAEIYTELKMKGE